MLQAARDPRACVASHHRRRTQQQVLHARHGGVVLKLVANKDHEWLGARGTRVSLNATTSQSATTHSRTSATANYALGTTPWAGTPPRRTQPCPAHGGQRCGPEGTVTTLVRTRGQASLSQLATYKRQVVRPLLGVCGVREGGAVVLIGQELQGRNISCFERADGVLPRQALGTRGAKAGLQNHVPLWHCHTHALKPPTPATSHAPDHA